MPGPNANGFASQWNIGLYFCFFCSCDKACEVLYTADKVVKMF